MSKYRISPGEVTKTLKATSKQAGEFKGIMAPMSDDVQSAATNCGDSGAIVPALNGLFTHEQTQMTGMATQIEACITGADAATAAYVHGDYQMVLTYQQNAKNAVITAMPKKYQ